MNLVLQRSGGGRAKRAIALACAAMSLVGSHRAWADDDEAPAPAIYAMNFDGGNFRQVAKLEGKWNGSPSLSPDNSKILFDASPVGYNFEQGHMYVVPAAGNKAEPTDLGLGSTPSWSPDGKQIVFYVHDDNPDSAEAGVWIMNADGSERTWVCYGKTPRWFPDGKRLIIVNNPDGEGDKLFVHDMAKKESEALIDRGYPRIPGASVSPDGKRLCFMAQGAGGMDLVILPLVGDDAGRVRLSGSIGYRPAWSAAGKQIVYWVRDDNRKTQLHIVDADTQAEPRMLPRQDAGKINSDATCSPDGKQIVFMSDR